MKTASSNQDLIQTFGAPSAAALALAVLTETAQRDPAYVQELFTQARQGNSEGIKALLKAAGVETLGDTRPAQEPEKEAKSDIRLAKPGELLENGSIYWGELETRRRTLYLESDTNTIGIMNFREAQGELARRNSGRTYGDGSEKAHRKAWDDDSYVKGDSFLPFMEFLNGHKLNGYNLSAKIVRPVNVSSMVQEEMRSGKEGPLHKLVEIIKDTGGSGPSRRLLSGSLSPGGIVLHVWPEDGNYGWIYPGGLKSLVLPFRARFSAPMVGG